MSVRTDGKIPKYYPRPEHVDWRTPSKGKHGAEGKKGSDKEETKEPDRKSVV